jgi:hypothetical protein
MSSQCLATICLTLGQHCRSAYCGLQVCTTLERRGQLRRQICDLLSVACMSPFLVVGEEANVAVTTAMPNNKMGLIVIGPNGNSTIRSP